MNCHDVRHLRVCVQCHQLADGRNLIPLQEGCYHGSCFADERGESALLALDSSVLGRLTVQDLGVALARKVLAVLAKARDVP